MQLNLYLTAYMTGRLTGGEFEANLAELALQEGVDCWPFG